MSMKSETTRQVMIENALRIAIDAGKQLLDGNVEEALSLSGACLAQLYALEASRQQKNGVSVVQAFKETWERETAQLQKPGFYRTAMQRSEN